MTKKTRLSAILAAALAVSSMAVSAIWLDHTSGSAGDLECHGYLYSYSAKSFGADTTASDIPYRVSVELSLSDGSGDFVIHYNRNTVREVEYSSASVTVSAKESTTKITSATAKHVVVDATSFDQQTSYTAD